MSGDRDHCLCIVLQCVAVCCSVLQCVVLCCSVLHMRQVNVAKSLVFRWIRTKAAGFSRERPQFILQCVAVCCSVLHIRKVNVTLSTVDTR